MKFGVSSFPLTPDDVGFFDNSFGAFFVGLGLAIEILQVALGLFLVMLIWARLSLWARVQALWTGPCLLFVWSVRACYTNMLGLG